MRVQALALDLVGDVEHIGGGDHDDVRLEILDQLHLLLGLAAGHGDHRAAQAFGAVVRPQAAGEQAIAVGNMHLVPGPAAGGADRARHHLRPGVDVVAGVADHRGLTGGAAGGVQAYHLVHGHGEHAIGVVVAQIGLGREGQVRQVFQALDVLGVHPELVEALAVQRDPVVGVVQAPAQAFQLVLAQVVDAGGFHRVQQRVGHGSGNRHVHGVTRIVVVL